MKTQKTIAILGLSLTLLAALSSCGKDKNNNANTLAANQCPVGQSWNGVQCTMTNSAWGLSTATCPVGQVNSQEYGCVTQGNCPTGQAMFNNACTNVTIAYGANPMINNPMANPMLNPGMNPMMNSMNPIMNNGFGGQMGVNAEFGMGARFIPGSEDQEINSDCNAYSQDDSIYYSCAPVNGKVRSSRARYMSNRELRGGCARHFVETSYGCLPKKGCRRGLGNLNGVCVE